MTMMNGDDKIIQTSDVKKENVVIQDCSAAVADSSLYSPTTTGLEFELDVSHSEAIEQPTCEVYEVGPMSFVRPSPSSEPDGSEKQYCSSTTNGTNGHGYHDQNTFELVEPVSAGLFPSSPRNYSSPEPDPEQMYCSSTTKTYEGLHRNSLQQEGYKNGDAPKRFCVVCGDVASGFHYGVASCEACKAFFKRTIQGNIEYTCPARNDCEINKRRRKACQACRFQKCITMGMLKEGVRLDRVRGGRQKYRRLVPYTTTGGGSPLKRNEIKNEIGNGKLLQMLTQFEPEMVPAVKVLWPEQEDSSRVDSVTRTLCTLSEIYEKELVLSIGWAKQIPGFMELPLSDQMRLLQTAWPEVLTLSLAFRSLPLSSSKPKLKWSADFIMDEEEAQKCSMLDFFHQCVQIAQRLEQLATTSEEYILLKALVLANSDVRVDNETPLKHLRESLIIELVDFSNFRHGGSRLDSSHLLLCLPCIRQIGATLRKFWTSVKRDMPHVPMNKLFLEMLETPHR